MGDERSEWREEEREKEGERENRRNSSGFLVFPSISQQLHASEKGSLIHSTNLV